MENQIQKTEDHFGSATSFEHAQRVAKMLSSSDLVPKSFQGNIQNTLIALEMANRIGASPLMVMQNLYIVYGKPSWSSTFIIAALNAPKKFSPLRYEMTGEGDNYGCTAWAYDAETKEKLEGPKVTWEMVKAEGWLKKDGSKWKTMAELMFRYRAAAFFGRLYAPEILMGMLSSDEVEDISYTTLKSEPVKLKQTFSESELLELVKDGNSVDDLVSAYHVPKEVESELRQQEATLFDNENEAQ